MPFLTVLFILAIVTLFASVKIVQQQERGIVLRLGKYKALADPGLNLVMPYIESMIKVDMRERVINVDPQKVITKDNVSVTVDAVIYYKIVDPVKAEFEVEDFGNAATTLAQTNLRNIVGDKTLDETLTARDHINTSLRLVLDEATNGWGVKVTRVEVQKIDPPPEITDAMSLQMKAEREKRAHILQAEGIKQSDITQAEGQKNSEILKAEGDAQAKILRADAEAGAIQRVAEAANKFFDQKAQAWERLRVSEAVLKNNTKYVLPTSSDIVNVLNLEGEGKTFTPIKKG
ncbi:SPFH/Band 7/PHB domain protein [Candidatus Roizmanbacteria bacterium CG_4_9_14_0_2_um_filter_39_13]|uniref:SPFH/Band 7/PHB domain protein n=1 Tax=Candidatus Roizmanbacteria bacterium CG_4_9_14_0_2_um_filter_39_13 TaxID=1974839 RepID=A0A2M8EXH4_9BACT|nr:MAG: SPFH/Band 7/PHB domain protein [Candidatus Roizmanbacteria bacterium CG_4_10_14_0_2_um_filter_39_12]PJC30744.1 MAG: SPFH/Band 7/PHB domain protein [Candidatus Roizmanbacteria bacterium CG_4_9_14_0_2_um_filter_39_13]